MTPALLLLSLAAAAQPDRPDPCAPRPQLYIAAMGEAFRAPAGAPYPSAAWFAAADADRDGRVTAAEFMADAERAFTRFDGDGDGEIEPEDFTRYEAETVPEISLYQRGQPLPREGRARRSADYGGAMGAGRFAQLNVPHPLASADLDFNRGVTRAEWRTVAARRFALLGPTDGALTLAALKPTPVQVEAAACAAAAARKRR